MIMIENCTFMNVSINLSDQNNKLFQISNVKLQRIVKVMEFVMVQEIVFAMIIGIQKRTALVFFQIEFSLISVYM